MGVSALGFRDGSFLIGMGPLTVSFLCMWGAHTRRGGGGREWSRGDKTFREVLSREYGNMVERGYLKILEKKMGTII